MKLAELLLKYDRTKMQNNSNVDPLKLEVFAGRPIPAKKDNKKKKKKDEFAFR